MTTHLEGRMPHNEIAALFAAAARAKSADDVHALVPRLQHVSAVFASVLREFRASLPANERNRGLPPCAQAPRRPADAWRPILDTFQPGDAAFSELGASVTGGRAGGPPGASYGDTTTLAQWRQEPVGPSMQ